MGAANGTLTLARTVGGSLGIALLGSLYAARMGDGLAARLGPAEAETPLRSGVPDAPPQPGATEPSGRSAGQRPTRLAQGAPQPTCWAISRPVASGKAYGSGGLTLDQRRL
ncbi:hypothetical protein ABZ815_24200 [Nonomuraea sp. NPDC047529]|uniref:hypothetical protein n=1 Tax=Nonomuraea sp. NPDC047529 TaxID=3155623 RepID=UPI0033F450F4